MRIVSLCPSNTETAVYAGLGSFLIATDNYSDWPSAPIAALPKLGSDLDIDIDAVERLQPDLILASLTVPGMEKNLERLERKGLAYLLLNPKSLADIGDNLLMLGRAAECLEQAQKAYQEYCGELESLRRIASQISVSDQPTLYWEWWSKPVYSPGGANWLTEISELAGGRNLFADDPRSSVQTDWDDIRKRKPDHICLAWVGIRSSLVKPELVRQRPGWSELEAVRANRLHVMEEPLYCRPSPRLLAGIRKLGAMLHPELYPAYLELKPWELACIERSFQRT